MLHLNKKAEIQILSGIREDEEQSFESIYSDVGGVEVKVPRLLSYILEGLVWGQDVVHSPFRAGIDQGEYRDKITLHMSNTG